MKTCEQLTAEVLARRDAFFAARDAKRRAAKKYTAASLLVFAAVFAAAGLFRSGWLGSVPPVSLPEGVSSGNTAEAPEPSGDLTVTAAPEADAEKGSAGAAVTTARAVPDAATGVDLSPGSSAYLMIPAPTRPTAERPTGPAKADAPKPSSDAARPERSSPATTRRDERHTPTPRQGEETTAPTARWEEWPTDPTTLPPEPPTAQSPAPTRPSSAEPTTRPSVEPITQGEPETEEPVQPSHPGNSAGERPSSHPAEEDRPGTEPAPPGEDPTQSEAPADGGTYIVYHGGLYSAADGLTVPVPEGAEIIGRETVIVIRNEIAVQTELLLLSCPSQPAAARTAIAAENEREMCPMAYLGTVEELLREDPS